MNVFEAPQQYSQEIIPKTCIGASQCARVLVLKVAINQPASRNSLANYGQQHQQEQGESQLKRVSRILVMGQGVCTRISLGILDQFVVEC